MGEKPVVRTYRISLETVVEAESPDQAVEKIADKPLVDYDYEVQDVCPSCLMPWETWMEDVDGTNVVQKKQCGKCGEVPA